MEHSTTVIEDILFQYRDIVGRDFDTYRNHAYRVFEICRKIDNSKESEEKYAIAAAFHDLGIWTNSTFDYLEPSIALAIDYLNKSGKTSWQKEISLMIDMHHKRSKYVGVHKETTETFRRADWIDVTKGRKLFGLPKAEYLGVLENYPNLGFHKFLVIQAVKNMFKSPFIPLPMFKK